MLHPAETTGTTNPKIIHALLKMMDNDGEPTMPNLEIALCPPANTSWIGGLENYLTLLENTFIHANMEQA